MSTEFCTNCGNKMEYSFAPPNFCSKCGNSLKGVATASTSPASTPTASPSLEEMAETEVVPILESLEYDISYAGGAPKVLTFEELASQQPAQTSKRKRKKPKKATASTQGDSIKQSIESCKSIGNKSLEIGGKEKTK